MSAAYSRKLVYGIMASLDGYIDGPDHKLDWPIIDEEIHRFVNARDRAFGTYLYGRRMYEAMVAYWPTAEDDPANRDYVREYSHLWKEMPKVVFSHSLERAQGGVRLVKSDPVAEVMRLKSQPGGDLCVGGARLAATFIRAGLVDAYHFYIHPVILGGGTPLFPELERAIPLQLVEMHRFGSGAVFLNYQRKDV